jgi:hypothetical protein
VTGLDLPGWADTLVLGPAGGAPAFGRWDVVATRAGALVLVRGDVVIKIHRVGTTTGALAGRLRLLAAPPMAGLWARLLVHDPVEVPDEVLPGRRVASVWRRLRALDPGAREQPWVEAAGLLARLHAVRPLPVAVPSLPAHGGPARLHRAVRRLRQAPGSPASAVVLRAGLSVVEAMDAVPPGHGAAEPAGLVHGDWHLGQVGYVDGIGPEGRSGALQLIDPDDLGTGDPAWDLARPAGFWAAGLLADDDWQLFLAAYRDGGGVAVPSRGDPWPVLDVPARAAVVVAATAALGRRRPAGDDGARAAGDEMDAALIRACDRIANSG